MRMQEEVQARLRTIRDRTTELVNHLTQVSSMIPNITPEDEEDAATFNYYINVLVEMVRLIVEIRGRWGNTVQASLQEMILPHWPLHFDIENSF